MMENITELVPLLWEIIGHNKKCSINVMKKENEFIVNILNGKKSKQFKHHDSAMLMSDIRQSFHSI